MSEAATGLFNTAPVFPRLVLDETLKRARVETSEGTAVRVTSATADLTPITDALGTQQDPSTTPTVIGLLKNLIANGGGGGAGSTYPVFKSFLCALQYTAEEEITSFPFDITLEDNLLTIFNDPETHYPVPTTAPDWATTILLFDHHLAGMCLINNTDKVGFQTVFSRVGRVGDDYDSSDNNIALGVASYTLMPTWQDGKWHLSFSRGNNDFIGFDTTDPATTLEGVKNGYYDGWGGVDMYALFLDTNPLSISGGGGGSGGEAISTYSLTLNNTTVTNIAAPTEDPPSSDDQTLITVSYRRGLPVKLSNDLVNNQSTTVAKEGSVNLESGFSITLPEWTELIKLGITNSGGYMDYVTMAADVNKNYVSVTGAGTIDVYSYNASTKDFTFVSGGDSIRILSLRVEGKTTI